MTNVLQRVGLKGPYSNIIKDTCDKPTTNITPDGEKLETIPLKS